MDFSDTLFTIGTRLAVKRRPIKDFSDSAGKTVIITAVTTSEVLLNKFNDEKQMKCVSSAPRITAIPSVPWKAAARWLFMMNNVLLASERAKSRKPDQ